MNLSQRVKEDQEKFLKDQQARLAKAAEYVQGRLKGALGEPGSHDVHAPKGQPPLRQTGTLLNSIKIRVSGDEAVIYSDCEYGKYLEKDHPWFLATITDCEPEVRRIIFGDTHAGY
jgi:hypothetical protein